MNKKQLTLLITGLILLASAAITYFTAPSQQTMGSQPPVETTTSIPAHPTPTKTDNLKPEPAIPYTSTTTDPETGLTVYELGEDQLGLIYNENTGKFNQYAPLPAHTFTRTESQTDTAPPILHQRRRVLRRALQ